MKPVLLLMMVFVFVSSSAQNFEVDVPKLMKGSEIFKHFNGPVKKNEKGAAPSLPNYSMASGKKPGISYLPLDHMPCIIPDTREIAPMPNAWSGDLPNSDMPNPALPKRPIVLSAQKIN